MRVADRPLVRPSFVEASRVDGWKNYDLRPDFFGSCEVELSARVEGRAAGVEISRENPFRRRQPSLSALHQQSTAARRRKKEGGAGSQNFLLTLKMKRLSLLFSRSFNLNHKYIFFPRLKRQESLAVKSIKLRLSPPLFFFALPWCEMRGK